MKKANKIMIKTVLGTMDFQGSVDVTDPCYDKDVWCRMNDVIIKKGIYACIVWQNESEGRIGTIGIYLNGHIPDQKTMKRIGEIGVDAGLAGFFHNKPDYDDESWSKFCDDIRNGNVWLTKDGFFSSSGYGDGCYGVYALTKGNKIVALEIRFL